MTDNLFFILPALVLVGGFGFVYAGIYARMKAREMAHRERLAMIERGLVPPPERDPSQLYASMLVARAGTRSSRQRSAGVMIVGLGLGLMMIISFVAQDPQIGLGVGGAVTIFGAAMLVNAHLGGDNAATTPQAPPQPPAGPPGDPPRS